MRKTAHYRSIEIEGFKSFAKPLQINLDSVGVNLIRGTNGVGKSTIIGALMWAEYGVNLTDTIATWEDIRPDGYAGTRVIVNRTDGEFDYMIARHLGYTGTTLGLEAGDKLMIFRKSISEPEFLQSHLIGDAGNKDAMNKLIEQQLGVNSEVFLNSIVMGQNAMNLIDMDNGDKRELFETLFETTFVAEAKVKADARQLELSAKLGALTEQEKQLLVKVDSLKDRRQAEEQAYNDAVEDRIQNLEQLKDSLLELREAEAEIKDKLAQTQKLITDYDTKALSKAKALVADLDDDLDTWGGILRKLQANDEFEKSKKEQLEQLKEEEEAGYKESLYKLQTKYKVTESKIAEYDTTKLTLLEERVKAQKAKVWDLGDEVEALQANIAKYVASHGRGTDTLKQQEESLVSISTKCPTCKGDLPKADIDKAKAEIAKQIEATKEGLTMLETKIAEFKASLSDKEIDYAASKLLQGKLTEQLTEIKEGMSGLDDLKVTLRSTEQNIKTAEAQISTVEQKIQTLLNKKPAEVKTTETLETLPAKIADLEDQLKVAKVDLEEARRLDTEQVRIQGEVNLLTSKLERAHNDVVKAKDTITKLQESEVSKEPMHKTDREIAETTEHVAKAGAEKEVLTAEYKRVDWWIKKGFHASGIRAFVFNAMLARLNTYASAYSERLGFRVEFGLDMSKKSRPFQTLVYKDGQVRSYKDLSGGQKKRALVCIGFAMYDLVCDKVNTNIMYLDELTDALDAEGVETLFDLIRVKAADKSVFIICHNDIINAMNTKEMYLALDEDKNTYIVS